LKAFEDNTSKLNSLFNLNDSIDKGVVVSTLENYATVLEVLNKVVRYYTSDRRKARFGILLRRTSVSDDLIRIRDQLKATRTSLMLLLQIVNIRSALEPNDKLQEMHAELQKLCKSITAIQSMGDASQETYFGDEDSIIFDGGESLSTIGAHEIEREDDESVHSRSIKEPENVLDSKDDQVAMVLEHDDSRLSLTPKEKPRKIKKISPQKICTDAESWRFYCQSQSSRRFRYPRSTNRSLLSELQPCLGR
jgi:hypothetical protein